MLIMFSTGESCAADSNSNANYVHWMQKWEVSDYLSKILLSYRLLFGQVKASRDLFNKCKPMGNGNLTPDPYLAILCSTKDPIEGIGDKEAYLLQPSFPYLRARLLKDHLDKQKPKGWMDLWRDRRDSAEWWTFWTVLFIGSLGLLLSFISTIATVLTLWRQW